jgi:hypothetical protein
MAVSLFLDLSAAHGLLRIALHLQRKLGFLLRQGLRLVGLDLQEVGIDQLQLIVLPLELSRGDTTCQAGSDRSGYEKSANVHVRTY